MHGRRAWALMGLTSPELWILLRAGFHMNPEEAAAFAVAQQAAAAEAARDAAAGGGGGRGNGRGNHQHPD
jgi:hypothetical protein